MNWIYGYKLMKGLLSFFGFKMKVHATVRVNIYLNVF